MKVIRAGTGQKGWAKECVCTGSGNGGGGCGAVLLVEQGDLYKTYSSDYGGGRDAHITFTCAECGVETDITVPGAIWSSIPDKASRGIESEK